MDDPRAGDPARTSVRRSRAAVRDPTPSVRAAGIGPGSLPGGGGTSSCPRLAGGGLRRPGRRQRAHPGVGVSRVGVRCPIPRRRPAVVHLLRMGPPDVHRAARAVSPSAGRPAPHRLHPRSLPRAVARRQADPARRQAGTGCRRRSGSDGRRRWCRRPSRATAPRSWRSWPHSSARPPPSTASSIGRRSPPPSPHPEPVSVTPATWSWERRWDWRTGSSIAAGPPAREAMYLDCRPAQARHRARLHLR